MAFSGQVLHNPVSGERFVFHTAAARPGGARLTARQRATGIHGEPS